MITQNCNIALSLKRYNAQCATLWALVTLSEESTVNICAFVHV
jgi:hypothetical protein